MSSVPERQALYGDPGRRHPPAEHGLGRQLAEVAGLALLGLFSGSVVALTGLNALYLAVSLIGCFFVLRDFRVGVVLLIVLMPISRSVVFPHAMLGITGLNPLNLLLVGTLGACLLHGLTDGTLRRFLPRPLLWLYIVPFLAAGALGTRHFGDIAPAFFMYDALEFNSVGGYARELVLKPLLLVVFALLVGAAVGKSARPERFLAPTWISIWVMGLMVIAFVVHSGTSLGELASSKDREFLSALGLHANDLGRLYAAAYALLLFVWAESRQPGHRLVLLASMALVAVSLVLTFSRGAFVAFVVVNVLFLLWRRNTKALLFFALLAAVALFLLPGAVYERAEYGFGRGLDAISAGRVDGIWLPLLPEVLKHPFFGSGLGSILWSTAMREGAGVLILGVTQAHNAYLDAVLDMGVVGLGLLGAYYLHVWRGLRALAVDARLSPPMRGFFEGAAAGLAGFLVAGAAGSFLTPVTEQSYLWLAIGMMYGLRARLAARPNSTTPAAHAGADAARA